MTYACYPIGRYCLRMTITAAAVTWRLEYDAERLAGGTTDHDRVIYDVMRAWHRHASGLLCSKEKATR